MPVIHSAKWRPVALPKLIRLPWRSVTLRPIAFLPGVACIALDSNSAVYSQGPTMDAIHTSANSRTISGGTSADNAATITSSNMEPAMMTLSIRDAPTRIQKLAKTVGPSTGPATGVGGEAVSDCPHCAHSSAESAFSAPHWLQNMAILPVGRFRSYTAARAGCCRLPVGAVSVPWKSRIDCLPRWMMTDDRRGPRKRPPSFPGPEKPWPEKKAGHLWCPAL